MAQLQCLECGKAFSARRPRCPACGNPSSVPFRPRRQSALQVPTVRRGALYTLLALSFGLFVYRQNGLEIPPVVVETMVPLLFLSGLGLLVYGMLQR